MDPLQFAPGVLAPAFVAGAILLFAWGLASGASRRDPDAPGAAAAIAVGAGALAGFLIAFGWHGRPSETWLWIQWVFPAAALFGAVEARAGVGAALRWTARIALV